MSRSLPLTDPCYFMLAEGMHDETKRSVQRGPKRTGCYICEDPEYALMGLPLCTACPKCSGHVAADDSCCDDCGHDSYESWCEEQEKAEQKKVNDAIFGKEGTDEEIDPGIFDLCNELYSVKGHTP